MQIELQSTIFSAYEHLIESEPRLFESHLYYDLHALDLENVWKSLGSGDRSRPLGVNEKKNQNHCQSYRWVGMCKKSILLLILPYDLFWWDIMIFFLRDPNCETVNWGVI